MPNCKGQQEQLILFIDMDAFFASVEQQGNPRLRGKPMGVVRKPNLPSVISAPSREAKKWGIKTGMITSEATHVYPNFKIVLEDPEKYTWASSQVFSILYDYTPNFQAMSVDEGWADITQITYDEFGGNPLSLAREIKERIRSKFGPFVTASIGIAPTRLMSKYAGELEKPNGLVWLKREIIPALLDTLEVDAVCGINKGFKRRLNRMGIYTLGDLGRCPEYRLRHFCKGLWGVYLKLIGQGKDSPIMLIDYVNLERKAYSHGRVLRQHKAGFYPSFEEAKKVLRLLCMKLARRMRGDGKMARVIYFHAASAFAGSACKQQALPHPTNDETVIYNACLSIAKQLVAVGKHLGELNGIAVQVSKLSNAKDMTLPLFPEDRQRQARLSVMDYINDEYGDNTIYTLDNLEGLSKFNWFAQNQGMYRDMTKYFFSS